MSQQIERLFHLSASPFIIAYTDDDGVCGPGIFSVDRNAHFTRMADSLLRVCSQQDETAIKSPVDLSEAIAYFASGTDDTLSSDASSTYTSSTTSSYDSSLTGGGSGGGKVTLKVQVVVEYDGPSLSDAGSVFDFSEDGSSRLDEAEEGGYEDWDEGRSKSSWASGDSRSNRSRQEGEDDGVAPGTRVIIEEDWDDEPIDLTQDPFLPTDPQVRSRTVSPHPLSQAHYPASIRSSPSASPSPTESNASSFNYTQREVDVHGHPCSDSHVSVTFHDEDAGTDEAVPKRAVSLASSREHRSPPFETDATRHMSSNPSNSSSTYLPLTTTNSSSSSVDSHHSKTNEFNTRWFQQQQELLARRANPHSTTVLSSASSVLSASTSSSSLVSTPSEAS